MEVEKQALIGALMALAAGGKILDRAGEPTGDAFPTAGNAGWIGVGGPAYLMEETAWKWISSSE